MTFERVLDVKAAKQVVGGFLSDIHQPTPTF